MFALTGPAATGIGSVPFTDPQETVALVLETLPQIPYWPQMVQLGYLEEMAAQAARGLPGLKVDEANRTVAMDPDLPRDEALAQFYELVLSGDLTPFAFEAQDARGFFALLAAVASQGSPGPALKGQLSGPVTFAGVVKDAGGQADPLRPGTDPGRVRRPGPQGGLAGREVQRVGQRAHRFSR